MQAALCIAYFAVLLLLASYGLHRASLVLTVLRHRKKIAAVKTATSALPFNVDPKMVPHVTIELPLLNGLTDLNRLL